ncbi:MAG: SDR family oxidoreductase [Rhizobiales bacterium]|nr:SDR family oxidoreductase [Hyphomicrobiales bacterium]NRB12921.1 SDR family oxidoreductase [Hyphomicrobiales bacterium]
MDDIATRVGIVTGGTTGIGEAISYRLLDDGFRVFAVQRDEREAEEGRRKFKKHSDADNIRVSAHDLSTAIGCHNAISECAAFFGRIDILVNNAGISDEQTVRGLLECSDEQIDMIIDTNLKAPIRLAREALPYLTSSSGVIINISSVAQFMGRANASAYVASKAGLGGLTRALGLELAPQGVRVVGIAPGDIETATSRSPDLVARRKRIQFKKPVPIGFSAQPKEVANAVAWLVSDQASYLTGTTIVIDGGLSAF